MPSRLALLLSELKPALSAQAATHDDSRELGLGTRVRLLRLQFLLDLVKVTHLKSFSDSYGMIMITPLFFPGYTPSSC